MGLVLLKEGLTVTAVTAKTFHSDHDVYELHITHLSLWNLFLCGIEKWSFHAHLYLIFEISERTGAKAASANRMERLQTKPENTFYRKSEKCELLCKAADAQEALTLMQTAAKEQPFFKPQIMTRSHF